MPPKNISEADSRNTSSQKWFLIGTIYHIGGIIYYMYTFIPLAILLLSISGSFFLLLQKYDPAYLQDINTQDMEEYRALKQMQDNRLSTLFDAVFIGLFVAVFLCILRHAFS